MTRTNTISMLLTLTATAGLAMAQPAKKQSDDNDLLRGPDVVQSDSAKDQPRELTEEERQAKMQEMFKEHPIEMREMTVTLRSLGNRRADRNTLNISQEQDDQLKAIMQKFREDMRQFQQDNMVKIREMRDAMNKEARERREEAQKQAEKSDDPADAMQEQGKDDAMSDRPAPREGEAARKLREFIASSPPSRNAIKSIKTVLSEEQFDMVQQHIFKTRMRIEQNRDARQGRNGEDDARRGPARRGVDADDVQQQRRDRDTQREKNGQGRGKGKDKPIDD